MHIRNRIGVGDVQIVDFQLLESQRKLGRHSIFLHCFLLRFLIVGHGDVIIGLALLGDDDVYLGIVELHRLHLDFAAKERHHVHCQLKVVKRRQRVALELLATHYRYVVQYDRRAGKIGNQTEIEIADIDVGVHIMPCHVGDCLQDLVFEEYRYDYQQYKYCQ